MNRPIKSTLVALLLFSLFSYSQDYNFNISSIPENLTKDANAVVRFEDITVEINSQTSISIKVIEAVTVLNKMGNTHKYVTVPFDKNTKVKGLKTIVYNASGDEIKKVKNKEYNNISSYDGFSLYSDSRLMYYEYIPVSYPYTIFVEYELESINTGFIPSWQPISLYKTSIEKSTYHVISKPGLELRAKEFNFDGYNITSDVKDISLVYEIKNQPILKNEYLSPEIETFTPKIMVGLSKFSLEGLKGEANSWSEFGKWRYDFLKNGNDVVNESIKIRVNSLIDGAKTDIEKAKIIYNYVQNKTRYISVQEGIGGWKPIEANTVDRVGYGDCKGLTNYTKALLDVAGVKSHYCVVWAGTEQKSVDKDFFSMQGNHIILNIPNSGDDIWLECTSQDMAFGELGDFTDNRDVLVVTPEGGVIKKTKKYNALESTQITKGNYKILSDGSIDAQLKIQSKGIQYDNHLSNFYGLKAEELDLELKEYFSNINNIVFSKNEIKNNKEDAVFEEVIAFTAKDYTVNSSDKVFVPINAFNKFTSVPKKVRDRKRPFEILRGFVDEDEVSISLPFGYNVEYIPEKIELETKFGNYRIEVIKNEENNTYLYKRKMVLNEGVYPKEDYEDYRSFRKRIRKYDNSKIILNKK